MLKLTREEMIAKAKKMVVNFNYIEEAVLKHQTSEHFQETKKLAEEIAGADDDR